jgi:hypothetical protein
MTIGSYQEPKGAWLAFDPVLKDAVDLLIPDAERRS